MKLQDLDLDLAGVVSAPLMRDKPEPDWVQGKESGVVPSQLFNLYESGSYLSFGSAPNFLSDKDNLLFSYFAMLLRSLKQQLQDGPGLLVELREAHAVMYDPVKKAKGILWDPDADDRAQRAFRELIVRAYSALDVIAELSALMFTDGIPQLPVGRAQFGAIEDWLRTPMSLPDKPTPYEALLGEFHGRLQPLVLSAGPEEDWVRLLRLLRNKAAHLGNDAFRFFGLLGPDEQLYFFVPRE